MEKVIRDINTECIFRKQIEMRNIIWAHSDKDSDMVYGAFILYVSLGTERDFIFTNKKIAQKINIPLKTGSVLLIGGDCQKNWKHEVPKIVRVKEPMINLTFRSIFKGRILKIKLVLNLVEN